jgi:hypothetical protein
MTSAFLFDKTRYSMELDLWVKSILCKKTICEMGWNDNQERKEFDRGRL